MSIKGIDTQIMINRSADLARDASAMMKRPELQQEALAFQQKIASAQAQSRVSQTQETEMENIKTDKDGGSGGAHGGGGEGSESDGGEQNEQPAKNMLVPPGDNVIDIKV